MPESGTIDIREIETRLNAFKEEFSKLVEECRSDGEIDAEEAAALKSTRALISQTETLVQRRKSDAEAEAAEAETGGSGGEEGDDGAAREAWEARTAEYRQVIVQADALQRDGNPVSPTLFKFLDRIDDCVAEDRWGEAEELLDLALMTLENATLEEEEEEEIDPGRAKWETMLKDYEALVRDIEALGEAEHPAAGQFEHFIGQIDRAVSEERWDDAIETLDLARSSIRAAVVAPGDPDEARETPEDVEEPAAEDWEAESSEAASSDREETAPHTTDPVIAENGPTEEEDDLEEEWLQMADQFRTLQELMQTLITAGHESATDIASMFADILEARSQARWEDAMLLLTNALASARALANEIASRGDEPPHTTEAIIAEPPARPDHDDDFVGPGGEEPEQPGRVNPASASISGSVGQGGRNAPDDVQTVQQLLNQNGAQPPLEVDGKVGPATVRTISAFQQRALGFADGRVDPGGQTWAALTGGSGAGGGAGGGIPGVEPADLGTGEIPGVEPGNVGGGEGTARPEDDRGGASRPGDDGGHTNVRPAEPPTGEDGPGIYVPPVGGVDNRVVYEDALAQEQTMRNMHQTCYENPGLIGKANALAQQDEARAAEIYGDAWNHRALGKQGYDSYPGIQDPESFENCAAAASHAREVSWHYNRAIQLFQHGDTQWGAQPPAEDEEGANHELWEQVVRNESLMWARYPIMLTADVWAVQLAALDPDRAAGVYAAANAMKPSAIAMVTSYRSPAPDADEGKLVAAAALSQGARIQCDIVTSAYQQGDASWDISEYEETSVIDDVEEAIDDAREAVEEAVQDVEDFIDDHVERAERAVDEAIEEAERTAEEFVDRAEEAVDSVIEEAEEIVDGVVEDIEEAAERAGEAVDSVVEEAEDLVDSAVEEAEEALDDVADFFFGDDDEEEEART